MPAPRTCRSCNATLPADVRWCGQCYEPVRELSARPSQPPGIQVLRPSPVYTRWQRGPTTFGPVGRLVSTAVVVLIGVVVGGALAAGAWPFALWFLSGYGLAAGIVLRHVWQPELVTDGVAPQGPLAKIRQRIRDRAPRFGRDVPLRLVGTTVLFIGIMAAALMWHGQGALGRYLMIVVLVSAGLGTFLAWFNDV